MKTSTDGAGQGRQALWIPAARPRGAQIRPGTADTPWHVLERSSAPPPSATVPSPASATQPRPPKSPSDTGSDEALLGAVRQALAKPSWHLGFPAALEARMEADQGLQRQRQMVVAGLLALLVYNGFLVNDWLARPEAMPAAWLWRLGVVTPFGLTVLALVHRGLPAVWREGLMASTLAVAMLASGQIYSATQSAVGAYDPFVFGLVFMAGNIAFPLRFLAAVVGSAAGLLASLPAILGSPLLPPDGRGFALGLLLGTAVFTALACYRIERATRQAYLLTLEQTLRAQAALARADHMARVSMTDALTGLANRRAFDEALQAAWLAAPTHAASTGLLLVDVDHFKPYNDHFGHPAGDDCLRRVAAAMAASVRDGDLVARIGGEEFAVLMPGVAGHDLSASAERLRAAVAQLGLPHDGLAGRRSVTVSVGATSLALDQWLRPGALMETADAALYAAKHSGRNQVQVSSGAPARAASETPEMATP